MMRFQASVHLSPARAPRHGYETSQSRPRRQVAILTVLAGAHLGALLLWRAGPHDAPKAMPAAISSLVLVDVAPPQPVRRARKAAASVPLAAPVARREPLRTAPAPAAPTMAVIPAPAPAVPAEPAPELPDLLDRAKASARRLASDLPANKASAPLTLEQSLGNAIAAAARPRTTTIEELQTADGRPLSKVSGPAGTYCVTRDGFGPSAGRDPFRDGPRDRVVRCPR